MVSTLIIQPQQQFVDVDRLLDTQLPAFRNFKFSVLIKGCTADGHSQSNRSGKIEALNTADHVHGVTTLAVDPARRCRIATERRINHDVVIRR